MVVATGNECDMERAPVSVFSGPSCLSDMNFDLLWVQDFFN